MILNFFNGCERIFVWFCCKMDFLHEREKTEDNIVFFWRVENQNLFIKPHVTFPVFQIHGYSVLFPVGRFGIQESLRLLHCFFRLNFFWTALLRRKNARLLHWLSFVRRFSLLRIDPILCTRARISQKSWQIFLRRPKLNRVTKGSHQRFLFGSETIFGLHSWFSFCACQKFLKTETSKMEVLFLREHVFLKQRNQKFFDTHSTFRKTSKNWWHLFMVYPIFFVSERCDAPILSCTGIFSHIINMKERSFNEWGRF